ncbi:hypothetical protein HDU79_008554 [Rhizoclosmatium sp. JEL0117]|nr:hypothetical protein HDU79_008554 [Rhizoclosmatium sp. JEL0117]
MPELDVLPRSQPSVKRRSTRTTGVSVKKPVQRFLYATDSFSLAPQPVQALKLDTSIFSTASLDHQETSSTLAFGNCIPLSAQEIAEREDLHVSGVFIIHLSVSEAVRESLKAVTSLLGTELIDSLTIQLPHDDMTTLSLNQAPLTPVNSTDSIASEPRRKSRRLESTVLPSPSLNPTEDGNSFYESAYLTASTEFSVKKIGVSSANIPLLDQFLQSANLVKTPVHDVIYDSAKEVRLLDLGSSLDVLEATADNLKVPLLISNDGSSQLLGDSFDNIVGHINSSTAEPVSGVSQDWTCKYTVFGETRSVLLQHGYLIMGSTQ